MTDALIRRRRHAPAASRERSPATFEPPELLDWLRSGRLTLVGPGQEPVTLESWTALPADVRARALADFARVVRSNAKAAVLFLR